MELSRIQKICAQVFDSKIKFGYIFGSAAKGRLSTHSDIDVAIWLKDAPASTDSAFHLKISYGVKLSDLDL